MKEKMNIVERLLKLDPNFIAPPDYTQPKKEKKIMLDEDEFAKNIGLIIGPSGQTQKNLEKQTGCKIAIRGKGSNNRETMTYDKLGNVENEMLHVLISANTEEQIEMAAKMIYALIDPKEQSALVDY